MRFLRNGRDKACSRARTDTCTHAHVHTHTYTRKNETKRTARMPSGDYSDFFGAHGEGEGGCPRGGEERRKQSTDSRHLIASPVARALFLPPLILPSLFSWPAATFTSHVVGHVLWNLPRAYKTTCLVLATDERERSTLTRRVDY